jgi:hypothetical protein
MGELARESYHRVVIHGDRSRVAERLRRLVGALERGAAWAYEELDGGRLSVQVDESAGDGRIEVRDG